MIDANYHMPKLFTFSNERCRDCAEKQRIVGGIGYRLRCKLHQATIRPAYRCDHWHKPGSLF